MRPEILLSTFIAVTLALPQGTCPKGCRETRWEGQLACECPKNYDQSRFARKSITVDKTTPTAAPSSRGNSTSAVKKTNTHRRKHKHRRNTTKLPKRVDQKDVPKEVPKTHAVRGVHEGVAGVERKWTEQSPTWKVEPHKAVVRDETSARSNLPGALSVPVTSSETAIVKSEVSMALAERTGSDTSVAVAAASPTNTEGIVGDVMKTEEETTVDPETTSPLPPPPRMPLIWVPSDPSASGEPMIQNIPSSQPQFFNFMGRQYPVPPEQRQPEKTIIIETPNGPQPAQAYLPPPEQGEGTVRELPSKFNFILPAADTAPNPRSTKPKNPMLLPKGSLKPKGGRVYDIIVSDGTGTPSPTTTTTTTTTPPMELAPPFMGNPALLGMMGGMLNSQQFSPQLGALGAGQLNNMGGMSNFGATPISTMGGGVPLSSFGGMSFTNGQFGGASSFMPFGQMGNSGVPGQIPTAGGINHSGVNGFIVPEGVDPNRPSPESIIGGPPNGDPNSAGTVNGQTIPEVHPGAFPGAQITSLGGAWPNNPFLITREGDATAVPQTPA